MKRLLGIIFRRVHFFFFIFFGATAPCALTSLMILKHNQQDATLYNILYHCQGRTCFRRFFLPSSRAQFCTCCFGYLSNLFAATASMDDSSMLAVAASFRRGVNEIFALLECYAARTRSYRRFGTTYRDHLQVSEKTSMTNRDSKRNF